MRKLMQRLTGRAPETGTAQTTYAAIVAQSRRPEFYARDRVPDTITGRFSVLVMHLAIVIPWLEERGDEGALAQAVLDRFVADMDSALREIGVGDLSVGKKMRKLAGAYITLRQAYTQAFAAPEAAVAAAVAEAVRRNIDPDGETGADLAALSGYATRLRRHLDALDPAIVGREGPAALFVAP
jgi:cytochrome b pre-mRNA-processing protein 3